ncbi:MAG: acetyl-CoA carboxylase, carboxyltransferase subunit beta [Christensenella sp.]|uniref:acetyl-CoA carboxylase, carboxyltransferase subunit beta n=1 Tax=Christensenella sp. TaxID=1935934 RepID=UPI002B219B7D|nr:acetyl-CoA carboxylase, carboxyltransferase subunit beta [Christensenella sp.]MEA5002917.1 acetyl-CoA carboxylase, carboxyltransferase subunit beta [Christensenella sp.]
MGLFSKKRKDITMRVYRTNQQAQPPVESMEDIAAQLPVAHDEEQVEGMWDKCPECGTVIYTDDLIANLNVCNNCNHHFRLSARQRIMYTADENTFEELNADLIGKNPLDFPGYEQKVQKIRGYTNEKESIITGACKVGGTPCVLAVMDGFFMMGSMGAAVGEKFTLAAEYACKKKLPLIAFTVSGGARMQEGLISLMQMSKTAAVLAKLDEAGLPFFVVITDPTTGGVTASFAMLGDVTIAEPNATIGFAGRRVIEQTIKQALPPTFQTSEFQLEKGFVDMIVARSQMKDTLSKLLKMHKGGSAK